MAYLFQKQNYQLINHPVSYFASRPTSHYISEKEKTIFHKNQNTLFKSSFKPRTKLTKHTALQHKKSLLQNFFFNKYKKRLISINPSVLSAEPTTTETFIKKHVLFLKDYKNYTYIHSDKDLRLIYNLFYKQNQAEIFFKQKKLINWLPSFQPKLKEISIHCLNHINFVKAYWRFRKLKKRRTVQRKENHLPSLICPLEISTTPYSPFHTQPEVNTEVFQPTKIQVKKLQFLYTRLYQILFKKSFYVVQIFKTLSFLKNLIRKSMFKKFLRTIEFYKYAITLSKKTDQAQLSNVQTFVHSISPELKQKFLSDLKLYQVTDDFYERKLNSNYFYDIHSVFPHDKKMKTHSFYDWADTTALKTQSKIDLLNFSIETKIKVYTVFNKKKNKLFNFKKRFLIFKYFNKLNLLTFYKFKKRNTFTHKKIIMRFNLIRPQSYLNPTFLKKPKSSFIKFLPKRQTQLLSTSSFSYIFKLLQHQNLKRKNQPSSFSRKIALIAKQHTTTRLLKIPVSLQQSMSEKIDFFSNFISKFLTHFKAENKPFSKNLIFFSSRTPSKLSTVPSSVFQSYYRFPLLTYFKPIEETNNLKQRRKKSGLSNQAFIEKTLTKQKDTFDNITLNTFIYNKIPVFLISKKDLSQLKTGRFFFKFYNNRIKKLKHTFHFHNNKSLCLFFNNYTIYELNFNLANTAICLRQSSFHFLQNKRFLSDNIFGLLFSKFIFWLNRCKEKIEPVFTVFSFNRNVRRLSYLFFYNLYYFNFLRNFNRQTELLYFNSNKQLAFANPHNYHTFNQLYNNYLINKYKLITFEPNPQLLMTELTSSNLISHTLFLSSLFEQIQHIEQLVIDKALNGQPLSDEKLMSVELDINRLLQNFRYQIKYYTNFSIFFKTYIFFKRYHRRLHKSNLLTYEVKRALPTIIKTAINQKNRKSLHVKDSLFSQSSTSRKKSTEITDIFYIKYKHQFKIKNIYLNNQYNLVNSTRIRLSETKRITRSQSKYIDGKITYQTKEYFRNFIHRFLKKHKSLVYLDKNFYFWFINYHRFFI